MKQFVIFLLAAFLLVLAGCGTAQSASSTALQETVYASNTSAEDCYLCGGGIESIKPSYWGQDNIALLSLNTFEIKPIEINRYDQLGGHLIKEYAGFVSFGGGGSVDGGFSAFLMREFDRGFASGTINFGEDEDLDIEKAASFLCADCLNEILPHDPSRYFGVGAIHLDTKEIHIFEENLGGFTLEDFYVDFGRKDQTGDSDQIGILIFYCPVRYEKNPE